MQYGLATYQADDATRPAFVFEGRLVDLSDVCLLYTSPSPRAGLLSRMPASA